MSATTDMPEAVKVIERLFKEGFASGSTDIVDELSDLEMVEHQFGLEGAGPQAIANLKKCIVDVHSAFPDVTFTVEDWAVVGDIAWVRATARATNSGPFFGPPTGRSLTWTVFDVVRVSKGRIAEHWGVPDRFEIMMRLGRLERPSA